MAIAKAKVAIGFIVAGILAVVSGVILLFVGPAIMKDQIIKVSSDTVRKLDRWILFIVSVSVVFKESIYGLTILFLL